MRIVTMAALAVVIGVAAPGMAADQKFEVFGVWQLYQIKDPMTDVVTVAATPDVGFDNYITLTCKPSAPRTRELIVHHEPYLGRGKGRLTYRVDERTAVDADVALFNKSGFLRGADAQAFFGQLPGAKRVRIRVVDQIIGATLGDYDITGVDGVLARMAVLCDGPAKP